MDMIIYQGGLTIMQGELYVAGVTVEVDGVLKRCQNITVVDDGVIRMKEMYDTEGKPTKVREFSGGWSSFRFWFLEAHWLTEVGPRIPWCRELEKEQLYCKCVYLVSKET